MCVILIQKCDTFCTFIYPTVHTLIPQFYGSTSCCVWSLCIDQKLFPERILIQSCRCGQVFHPFLTIFDNLGCCLFCQSRYKIIFSHTVLLPVIDTTKRQPHKLHDCLSMIDCCNYSIVPKLKLLPSGAFFGANLDFTSATLPSNA